MEISLEIDDNKQNVIGAYEPGRIRINSRWYTQSLCLSPTSLLIDWPPINIAGLRQEHMDSLIAMRPELVLLGTGDEIVFPPAELFQVLIEQGIGYEIMNTAAACRTYNMLMSESRKVAAGLIIQNDK